MNDVGIVAAMRTANASRLKMWLVKKFGLDYDVDDRFMSVTVHYKLFNGHLYFIDYTENEKGHPK